MHLYIWTVLSFTICVCAEPAPVAGVVRMPVSHRARTNRRLDKRDNTVTNKIMNRQTAYYAEFQVGTPGQTVHGLLDTGSSDIWVYGKPAGIHPSYDANSSSTYEYVNSDFRILYAQGTGAYGDFVKDRLTWGDFAVKDQQFAVVEVPTQPDDGGIFGIGLIENTAAPEPYPNLSANMKKQGIISRDAYSLFLNDPEAGTGSILFGGIDDAKYSGELETVDIVENSPTFAIPISYEGFGEFEALLDSGSTFMYLPFPLVDQIVQKTGAKFDLEHGGWVFSEKPQQGISFMVGNKEIEISPDELAMKGEWVGMGADDYPYALPILPSEDMIVMGQSFLRSCYTVFDLEQRQVRIAQASFSKKSSMFAIKPAPVT